MKQAARAVAAIAAACIALSPAAHAAKAKAPACVQGADETALQMRVVQTDLMVAALSCKMSANYNAFVKGNQQILMGAHDQLKKYFSNGRGGEKALNGFITRLANDSSKRSIANIAQFCLDNGYLYTAILDANRGDLAAFIAPLWVAQRHGFTPCTPRATYIVIGPEGPVEVVAPTAPAPQTASDATAKKAP